MIETLHKCRDQNIFIVELRHIFGMLFDQDRNPVPLKEEIELLKEIIEHMKVETEYFEVKLIIVGLKIIGK